MIGTKLGSYTLLRELGHGGMGAVYIGAHDVLGRQAAIKVLLPSLAVSAEATARFLNEARAASAIRHPGIVEIYDVGSAQGSVFIVMELLAGQTLSSLVRSQGPLAWPVALRVSRQICRALEAAHQHGIIHRDLKAENVFLVPDENMPDGMRVKLLDFGIAKLADGASTGVHTHTHVIMGTPWYMSPEQCRSSANIDARADLYSLGCLLFEMLAGRVPFPQENPADIIASHMLIPPPSVRTLVAVPDEVDALVASLLVKDPAGRPADAGAVVAWIDRIVDSGAGMGASASMPPRSGPMIAATPPNTTLGGAIGQVQGARTAPPPAKGRWGWIAGGLGGLVAASAVAFVMMSSATSTTTSVVAGGGSEPGPVLSVDAGPVAAAIVVDAAPVADTPPVENRQETAANASLRQALKLEDPGRVRAAFAQFDRSWPSYAEAKDRHDRFKDAYLQRELTEARALASDGKCDEMRRMAKHAGQVWPEVAQAVLAEPCQRPEKNPPPKNPPPKQPEPTQPEPEQPSAAGSVEQLAREANMAARTGQYGRALKLCEDVLKRAPSNIDAMTTCGFAACNLKMAAKAQTYIGKLPTTRASAVRQSCLRMQVRVD